MAIDDAEPHEGLSDTDIGRQLAGNFGWFSSLTGDFYRGEVDRTTSWRKRLDQTTNWAVVVVAAILTWAFSSPDHPHFVILIGVFGVSAFLFMEANRYREYDVWRARVRTLQAELFANMYDPESPGDPAWLTRFSEDLRNPSFSISYREALAHRLRRSYIALLLILLAAWITRITLLEPQERWQTTASIFGLSGGAVAGLVGAYYLLLIGITVWSARRDRVREFQE